MAKDKFVELWDAAEARSKSEAERLEALRAHDAGQRKIRCDMLTELVLPTLEAAKASLADRATVQIGQQFGTGKGHPYPSVSLQISKKDTALRSSCYFIQVTNNMEFSVYESATAQNSKNHEIGLKPREPITQENLEKLVQLALTDLFKQPVAKR
jgi:hypothetical protein